VHTHRLFPAALLLVASTAAAQRYERSAADWLSDCRSDRWGGDDERACDVRETTIPARGGRIRVDGGQNGGITISGWDRNEIKVVARLQANGRTQRDAEDILKDIRVVTSSEIRAEGPSTGRREGWSVSFDVYVPRHTNLDLETHNGGIKIADVDGQIRFDAVNGGVKLAGLAGDVRGATENGGLSVTLDGDRWRGAGLDVRTQNGGVKLDVPTRYNADLETGTVNGHVDLDFPVTVSGRLGRTISTRLGGGGAPIRVRTTNGGVSIRQR
jgi:DUF4097 and DUF4098 domain-containing protein YvlB